MQHQYQAMMQAQFTPGFQGGFMPNSFAQHGRMHDDGTTYYDQRLQGNTVKHNQSFQNEALKRKARILEIRKPRAQSHLSNEKTGIYNHWNIKFKDDIYEV